MATPKKAQPAGKTAGGKKTAKPKTATGDRKSTTKTNPSTEFHLYAPEAGQVSLAGDFSDWQPEAYPMRRFKDGNWKKSLKLKPGRYEYRFVVDGQWWTDPENPSRQYNPYGQENSVLIVS